MIAFNVSRHILTVGEEYRDHRGGIAGVINTYSKYLADFKFISTYKPQPNKLLGIPYYLKAVIVLIVKLTRDKEIRIVHIHGAAKGSFFRKLIIFLIAKKLFKRQVIYHIHGSEFQVFFNKGGVVKTLIKKLINNVDMVICLSRKWETFFQENFEQKNLVVLENIIERPRQVEKLNSSFSIKILFLGRIGVRKGIFDLLDVIKENKQALDGKLQLIVGGDGEVEKLLHFVAANDLESIVRYEGWVSGSKKTELLCESDIYILPSYNEGLPLSILEAMSYELPVISTPVGGITEIVHHMINGFIVNPGDKLSLYSALEMFINKPELIKSMGVLSHSIVSPYYADAVIPKLSSIYEKLLKKELSPVDLMPSPVC
ncbi:glycosyltransferase family 4 protein [Segetibacter aerophilus]|uniref:Polysaccharide biosynthesis protein n=1 Tax=Segetibacter aerophilus TaxID=670293 RepID=A0A512BD35_9BACT|nr:glycosyltransferase family 4 protein [Segetibacter aerophilus]GEO09886.1 polysaccharide biosynthesis protein [Segetibacter aerophilus]